MFRAIFYKDILISLRSRRFRVMLILYNLILILVGIFSSMDPDLSYFEAACVIGWCYVIVITPTVFGPLLSSERELAMMKQLHDSKMRSRDIVIGKLIGGYVTMGLILISSLPVMSTLFVLSGLRLRDLLLMILNLLLSCLYLGCICLVFSALSSSSVASIMSGYALICLLSIGLIQLSIVADRVTKLHGILKILPYVDMLSPIHTLMIFIEWYTGELPPLAAPFLAGFTMDSFVFNHYLITAYLIRLIVCGLLLKVATSIVKRKNKTESCGFMHKNNRYILFLICFVFLLSGCQTDDTGKIQILPTLDVIGTENPFSPAETILGTETVVHTEAEPAQVVSEEDFTEMNPEPYVTISQEHNIIKVIEESTSSGISYFLTVKDPYFAFEKARKTGDLQFLSEKQKASYAVASAIVRGCENLDRYEQIAYVHDYLVMSTSYGYSDNQYNEYGALVEHVAVCQGYAYAFKLCMDLLEIPCLTLGGTAINTQNEEVSHAWNIVYYNDNWYHIDCTWDDPNSGVERGSWCHAYFMLSDDEIYFNHTFEKIIQSFHSLESLPQCLDESKTWYKTREGCLATNQETFEALFVSAFRHEVPGFEIRCVGFEPDFGFISSITSCSLIRLTMKEGYLLGFFL